ncbi:protein TonB [Mucilaginibacter yixingensis]|uniref:Protein TonB n=1 Tax=Mucilaginibacter yixingensis TaxID=1295612 RepID=A0A2T5J658_9SPHI|nr:energy transducer TonB [Mucilaginibacter yixingensis]PTQ94028.1 protein TonB [Mucilaginibacter yixingensis]
MLISELDLCKREWLELVFAGRNKTYGAYELRTRYNGIMLRAVAATVFVVSAFAITANIISHHPVVEDNTKTITVTIQPPPSVKPKENVVKVKPEGPPPAAKPAQPASIQRYVPYVVKPDIEAEHIEPIKEDVAIGNKDVNVPNSGPAGNVLDIPEGTPGGTGTNANSTTEDPGTVFLSVEDMPQPKGGPEAWSKFLQKNLRYPGMAQEAGASGKVFLSFIIEKDGHLTDIKLVRGAGYGFDEEALRVLKLAPAWSPGKQNGNPVRVQYTIPINFQLSNDN